MCGACIDAYCCTAGAALPCGAALPACARRNWNRPQAGPATRHQLIACKKHCNVRTHCAPGVAGALVKHQQHVIHRHLGADLTQRPRGQSACMGHIYMGMPHAHGIQAQLGVASLGLACIVPCPRPRGGARPATRERAPPRMLTPLRGAPA